MKKHKVAIIGGGNLGTALAKGLLRSKQFSAGEILISEKRTSRISFLKELGFSVSDENSMIWKADYIFIAVKPQQFESFARESTGTVSDKQLIISAVTGITHMQLEETFGTVPNVRIMPNIALEICESMTCISFSNTNNIQEKAVTGIFEKMGKTIVIDEGLMGAATVIGACGIAFALRFMRAMSQGGIEIGFNSEMSHLITAQTIKGAAGLILETSDHPERAIDKVTTPQGITISGLNEMEHQGLSSAVIRGLITSFNKIENMSGK